MELELARQFSGESGVGGAGHVAARGLGARRDGCARASRGRRRIATNRSRHWILYGNAITLPRFECNLVLQKRKAAGDVVRGVRNSARLLLTYGSEGTLELRVENAMALERAERPAWSNAAEVLDGGWPSYEFGDGSNATSGNRAECERRAKCTGVFAEYGGHTESVDGGVSGLAERVPAGQFFAGGCGRRGAQRAGGGGYAGGGGNRELRPGVREYLKLNLDRSVRGNTYVEFDTSVKAWGSGRAI